MGQFVSSCDTRVIVAFLILLYHNVEWETKYKLLIGISHNYLSLIYGRF